MTEEEKIDHDLKNRIIEVFDHYDDELANEGWVLLRQKYPSQNRKRLTAWPWYAAAAVLLLFLGIWMIQKPATNNYVANKTVKYKTTHKNGSNPLVVPHYDNAPVIANKSTKIVPTQKSTYLQPYTTKQKQVETNVLVKQATPAVTATQLKTNGSNSNNTAAVQKNVATPQLAGNNNAVEPNTSIAPNDNKQEQVAQLAQASPSTEQRADNMEKLLSEKTNNKKSSAEKEKLDKRQIFSIYAGTHLSYAQGSDNQLNVGAGFAGDFKISKRIKITAGLAIAQNRLSYNNNSTTAATASQTIFGSVAPAANLEQGFASSNVMSFGLAAKAPVAPVLKKYSASLVGLDVPVSIKYEFNPNKGQTYVTAGFSSGTFINETYISSYSSLQKTQENTTTGSFSSFNLAKTLDFSFGWGYSLGKSNMLIVEPFLKYPVNGAGIEQIRFGMSGINLKLGFKH